MAQHLFGQDLALHRLAGLGAAELQHTAAGRRFAEVVIEGNDAMNFGPRQIQRRGDLGNGRRRDTAELGLHIVQDRQQRTFQPLPHVGDVARKALILARTIGIPIELDQIEIESLVPDSLRDGSVDLDADGTIDTQPYELAFSDGTCHTTTAAISRLYPRADEFRGLARAWDPDGVFRNPVLDTILGPP